tara:strand:+ start:2003 stop:2518 length:516 start_codon:yes stop_codon:yes gene_type:complete
MNTNFNLSGIEWIDALQEEDTRCPSWLTLDLRDNTYNQDTLYPVLMRQDGVLGQSRIDLERWRDAKTLQEGQQLKIKFYVHRMNAVKRAMQSHIEQGTVFWLRGQYQYRIKNSLAALTYLEPATEFEALQQLDQNFQIKVFPYGVRLEQVQDMAQHELYQTIDSKLSGLRG